MSLIWHVNSLCEHKFLKEISQKWKLHEILKVKENFGNWNCFGNYNFESEEKVRTIKNLTHNVKWFSLTHFKWHQQSTHTHQLWGQCHLCHCDQWKTKPSHFWNRSDWTMLGVKKSAKSPQTRMPLPWRGSEKPHINCLSAVSPYICLSKGPNCRPISVTPDNNS